MRPLTLSAVRRRTLVLAVTLTAVGAGVALANTPEGGFQPGVTITVTPSDNLSDQATVHVEGTGFGNQRTVNIYPCDTLNPQSCGSQVGPPVTTNATGQFAIDVAVTRTFTAGTPPAARAVNCGTEQCVLSATNNAGPVAQHHINFTGGIVFTGPTTTSSTLPPTTVASTTTTTGGVFGTTTTSTTTTVATSTSTSTTTTTTSGAATTTTTLAPSGTAILSVEPADPADPTAAAHAVPVRSALPRTGPSTGRLAPVGVALILLGLMLVVHASRPAERR